MTRTRTWPVVGVVLAVLWLFVRGVGASPTAILGEFLLGLAVGLPLAFVFRRLYAPRRDVARTIRVAPYAVLYAAVFVWELVTANLDVAYRVLSPSLPIKPDVIVVPLRVETSTAITTIANSITLTPGTLAMDYDEEHNALYVHAIDGRDPAAVVDPIRTWEEYALVIFDEEGQPGDPIPEIPLQGAEAGANERAASSGRTDGGDRRGD